MTQTKQIQSEAMLVDLNIGSWTATTIDPEATSELLEQKHAASKSARVRKTLVSPKRISAIRSITHKTRNLHDLLTIPWNDKGERLLPVRNFDNYRRLMDDLIEQRYAAVLQFCNHYDDAIQEARDTLGDLFDSDNYEPVEEIRGRYYANYGFSPVPDGKHFIADIGEEAADRIRKQVQQQVEQRLMAGVTSLYGRLAKAVTELVDHIRPERDTDKTPKMHDSMLQKLRDVVDAVPALNLTSDPELTALCQDIGKRLDGIDMEAFRPKAKSYDPTLRQQVTADLDSLKTRLSGYLTVQ